MNSAQKVTEALRDGDVRAASLEIAIRSARVVFDKRSRDKDSRNVEVHIRENELAGVIGAAVEIGIEAALKVGRWEGTK